MKRKFTLLYCAGALLLSACSLSDEDTKNILPFSNDYAITIAQGDALQEEQIVISRAFYVEENSETITLVLSNNKNVSCSNLFPAEYENNETSVRVSIVADEKEGNVGRYSKNEAQTISAEIIDNKGGTQFAGEDVGSVEIITDTNKKIEGTLQLKDIYNQRIFGDFEAEKCDLKESND